MWILSVSAKMSVTSREIRLLTLHRTVATTAAVSMTTTPYDEVFGSEDVLALILAYASHAHPWTLVSAGRVSKTWHATCMRDGSLALAATRSVPRLTKNVLMGMLCLSSKEADSIPRRVAARRSGGVVYEYDNTMVHEIWAQFIESTENWRDRIAARARRQRGIELAFGAGWRVKQYPMYWVRTTMAGKACPVY